MKTKAVPITWIRNAASRFDTSPYLAGGIEAKIILERSSLKTTPLRMLTQGGNEGIFNGPHFKRNFVKSPAFGVPFISTSTMLRASLDHLPLLLKKDAKSLKLSRLKLTEGTSLISCSGTVGNLAFVRPEMAGMWSSQDVLKVVPKPACVGSGYLYAFLHSKFGIPQILAGTYGAIIQHLEPEHISELPIPRLSEILEKEVHEKIIMSANLISESSKDQNDATALLFDSVGIKEITRSEWHQMGKDLSSSVMFPQVESFRALNHGNRFQQLKQRIIGSKDWKTLAKLTVQGTLRTGPRFKRIDGSGEHGIKLLGQRSLFQLAPKGRLIARSSLPNGVKMPEGAILIAAHGTFGETELYSRSRFIWGKWTDYVYSQDMLRVIADPSMILPGALYAFLRSEFAFRMLRSSSTGTNMQEYHYKVMPLLPIPYPDAGARTTIHNMIVSAHEKEQKGIQLEEDAIRLVDNAIEKA